MPIRETEGVSKVGRVCGVGGDAHEGWLTRHVMALEGAGEDVAERGPR